MKKCFNIKYSICKKGVFEGEYKTKDNIEYNFYKCKNLWGRTFRYETIA